MKKFLIVAAIIAGIVGVAVMVLKRMPEPVTIREDFVCGDE